MESAPAAPPNVFISYRRTDSPGHAGRLHDTLRGRFGREHVFYDVSTVEAGLDFSLAIRQAIDQSAVLVAVIGPEWGERRLLDRLLSRPDWVRFEIEYARKAGKPILPVLVDGASMPRSLPPPLRFLSTIHATTLRDDTWDSDVERLVARLPVVAATPVAVGTPIEEPSSKRNHIVAAVAAVVLIALLSSPGLRTLLTPDSPPPSSQASESAVAAPQVPAASEPVSKAATPPPAADTERRPAAPAPEKGRTPPNRPPTTGSIAVDQFNAVGLMSATKFTLTAKGITDPDDDEITYRWDFGDGTTKETTEPTVTKTYERVSRFEVQLSVTDGKLSRPIAAASTLISVRDITGTWLLNLVPDPNAGYVIPTSYEVTLTQQGNQLSGRITPTGGRSTVLTGYVEHPNRVHFGSESAWWNDQSDAYFDLYVSDGALFIQMMNRTPGRCGPQIPCQSALMKKQ